MREILKTYRRNLYEIRRLSKIKKGHMAKRLRCENKKLRPMIESYIKSVADPVDSFILHERILNGRTWVGVAMRLGGGNTPDSVRIKFKRLMEELQDEAWEEVNEKAKRKTKRNAHKSRQLASRTRNKRRDEDYRQIYSTDEDFENI